MAYPQYPYGYPNYYSQPAQDQLAMLRQNQMMQQPVQMPVGQMPQAAQQPQQAQSSSGIQWVQGEEGAKAWMVAPGASVLLMDSENPTFYIKSSDNSGMPLPLRIFDYRERAVGQGQMKAPAQMQPQPLPDYEERFDAIEKRLEAVERKRNKTKTEEENSHE